MDNNNISWLVKSVAGPTCGLSHVHYQLTEIIKIGRLCVSAQEWSKYKTILSPEMLAIHTASIEM